MARPVHGLGLLTNLQQAFLRLFSGLPDQGQFYLTGGTALSEYYFGHRLSLDLDLFTGVDDLVRPMSYQVERAIAKQRMQVMIVRRLSTIVELAVALGGESVKVEMALDSPFRFAPPVPAETGVLVNDYADLRVDKLLAYYGRAEPRDAVDLYFILQREPLPPLLSQAAQKDPGFDLYWFAVALNRSATFPDEPERWPVQMLVPWQPVAIKECFGRLALDITHGLVPG